MSTSSSGRGAQYAMGEALRQRLAAQADAQLAQPESALRALVAAPQGGRREETERLRAAEELLLRRPEVELKEEKVRAKC